MKSDKELQKDVIDELRWEPGVNAEDIGVTVKDGVVTLDGSVDSYAEKWAARQSVKRVSGVKALAVEVHVKLPGSTELTDAGIARAAENALQRDVTVPSDRITVSVERGFLTLEGEVEWQFQSSAAEQAVRHLPGVTDVDDVIIVKPKVVPAEVKEKIEAAFKRNAILDASQINVQADGGKVTLTGSVHTWAERDVAENVAWAAPGVSAVRDELKVSC